MKIFWCLVLAVFISIFFTSKVEADVLFEDNFNNYSEGSFPTKWTVYNGPGETLCAAQWKILSGTLNIKIEQGGCSANIIPSAVQMPNMLSDYVLETDVRFSGGTDRSIIYRVNPNTNFFRTIHLIIPGDFDAFSDNPVVTFHLSKNYTYNHTYRFKVVVTNGSLKIYSGEPDGDLDLVHEVSHLTSFEEGIPGLGSSPGSGVVTETWFDNVRVTTLDHVDPQPEPGLPVPLLKQTDPLWGSDLYDSADFWSSDGTTMSRWGCAVTSAAMVFQYHGLEKMSDSSDLNPGTVNQWLKNQPDGYVRNGLLNWIALSRLSKQLADANNVAYDALEYERRDPDDAFLADSINNQSLPAILSVPGHFILAKGVDSPNSTFWINDPFYDIAKLSDTKYGNTYAKIGTFIPSNTDLSYMMLVVNPHVDLQLIDPTVGDIVGEITIEDPIDDAEGEATNSVGQVKILILRKPVHGEYELNLSSLTGGPYTIEQYFYDTEGEVKIISTTGNLLPGKTDTYIINYNKEDSSQTNSTKINIVTFDSIKEKIKDGYEDKKIKSFGSYLSLLIQLEVAKKSRSTRVTRGILDLMAFLISKDRKIEAAFGQELIEDIKTLKNSL